MKTRAAVAYAAGKPLEITTVELDGPKQGEVLVEIKATGICHTDEFTRSGADPEGLFPAILGHEGAGIVVDVGPGVTSLKKGDLVNTSPGEDDCGGPFQPLANSGHNIERQETCGFDKPNRNPKLESLKRNGGPTKTMALKPGSPAINRGLGGKVCSARDQRGKIRPRQKCDIGAFERVRSD